MINYNSKIKRLLVLVVALFVGFTLVGCDNKDEKILKDIVSQFQLSGLNEVTSDLDLPKEVKMGEYVAKITWESNNPEVIEIVEHTNAQKKDKFYLGKVTFPDEDNVNVTLTATFSYGKKSLEKKLTATVLNLDLKILTEIYNAFLFQNLSGVTQNIDLPKEAKKGDYVATVTWTSSNPSVIEITEGQDPKYFVGKVTRPTDEDVTVNLTATLKYGSKTKEKVFTAKVLKIDFEGATSISEVKRGTVGAKYTVIGTVVYTTEKGFIIQDRHKDLIYVFGSNHNRTVGELVEINGEFDIYYNMPQLKNASVKVIRTEEVDLTADAVSMTVSQIANLNITDVNSYGKIAKIEASISKSGNYINISEGNVRISLHTDSLGKTELESFNGKEVELVVIVFDYHSSINLWRVLYVEGSARDLSAISDNEKVDRAVANLQNEISTTIYGKIDLPTTDSRYPGLTIAWQSSNPDVLSHDGVASDVDEDTVVTLTATITLNDVSKTVTFEVTVKKSERLTVSAARQIFTFDDKTHFMWFSGIIIGFDKYGYFVADANTSIYVRDNKSNFNIGDEVEIKGTGKIFFGSGKTSADYTQVTVQVDAQEEGFSARKLSSNNPLPLQPITLNVTDFTSVPKTIEGTKNASFYGKLVKVSGKLVTAQSGAFTNLYIQDAQGNKVMIYHNSNSEALAKLNEALGFNVTLTVMPIDQTKSDGWRLVFFDREGDFELNATRDEIIDYLKDEINTIVKHGDEVIINLDFRTKSNTKAIVPAPRFEWSTNSPLIDSTGKVTRPADDTEVEITVKIYLADETTPAATVSMTVTVKAEGAVVWIVETFDNFPHTSESYFNGNFFGVNGIEWEYNALRGGLIDRGNDYSIDGKGVIFANQTEHKGGVSFLKATISGGIGDFKVDTLKAFTSGAERKLGLYINGELKGEFTLDNSVTTVQVFEVKGINVSGTFTLELRMLTPGKERAQITIDNLTWTTFE